MSFAGAVLAGGLGRRMAPERKATVLLAGRPMIERPLAVIGQLCDPLAVVCKRETALPELQHGVERWEEPDLPRHPLTGVLHALERAGGPVLVCAADMPFVDLSSCQMLIDTFDKSGTTVVGEAVGRLQPVFAVYAPDALEALRAAVPDAPLTETVRALSPVVVEVAETAVTSIDTPAALVAAEARLSA